MTIHHITSGYLGVNSYFIIADDKVSAVLIDGGENYQLIKQTEKQLGVKIKVLLLTHAHYDHVGNAKKLQDDGVKVFIGKQDAEKLKEGDNPEKRVGKPFESLTADCMLVDGDILNFFGLRIKVIETPGHTNGSVCYLVDNALFTGDTLFFESIGRTDFATGNSFQMQKSLKKLFSLEGDYKVYPGHADFTTLAHERKYNPYYKNV